MTVSCQILNSSFQILLSFPINDIQYDNKEIRKTCKEHVKFSLVKYQMLILLTKNIHPFQFF